jgi:hypothetical protein
MMSMMITMPRGGARKGAGRKAKYDAGPMGEIVSFRATREQVKKWTLAASSQDLHDWIREALDARATHNL